MTKKERYKKVIEYFQSTLPEPETELKYRSPYELLVAVILSAQCTDKRVNETTPNLFEHFRTPELLASAQFDEVFPIIKSISYPNNKSKHLIGMAKMLVKDFNGEVPSNVDDLQKLPGVGRKTANVVASVIFNKDTFPVDTHVFRVTQRIGLAEKSKTPLQVEKQIIKNTSKEIRGKLHHWLILHGRYICLARKPKCEECGLTAVCKFYKKNISQKA